MAKRKRKKKTIAGNVRPKRHPLDLPRFLRAKPRKGRARTDRLNLIRRNYQLVRIRHVRKSRVAKFKAWCAKQNTDMSAVLRFFIANHERFRFRFSKWGIDSASKLTSPDLQERYVKHLEKSLNRSRGRNRVLRRKIDNMRATLYGFP